MYESRPGQGALGKNRQSIQQMAPGTLGGRVRQAAPVKHRPPPKEEIDDFIWRGDDEPPEDFRGFLWFRPNEPVPG